MWSGLAERERSCDTLFDGSLQCLQYVDGYRFSIDPVLLAHFVQLGKGERVLDLGAGCGIVGLILLYRAAAQIERVTAFELQPDLLQLIRENIRANGFHEQMIAVAGDLRCAQDVLDPESFSTVVCNPPFYALGSGRKSRCQESEIARHEVSCSLAEVLAAAALLVKNRGRVLLVYPAAGIGKLSLLMGRHKLTLKRLQFVYSYPDPSMEARLLLVEAIKNGGAGTDVLPPFYIYKEKNGAYDKYMQRIYDPH